MSKTVYHHLYTLPFEVPESTCPQGSDVSEARLMECLLRQLAHLSSKESGSTLVEMCDKPVDTTEERISR